MAKTQLSNEEQFDRFTQKLNELQSIIAEAIAYFYAWRGLRISDKDTIGALNRYKGFFAPTRKALQSMCLLQLAKLFDKDRRTVSFRTLLVEARANREVLAPFATQQGLDEIIKQIDGNEAVLVDLKGLRDQRLAHHDAILGMTVSLDYEQVAQVIRDIESMYNALRRGHDTNFWSFNQIVRGAEHHTSRVVQMAVEDREEGRRRIEEANKALRRHGADELDPAQ